MEIKIKKNNENLVIQPIGHLDSASGAEFSKALEENFTSDVQNLTINFNDVDFISSNGLRIIISVYKNLNGRQMKIIGANESVKEIFRLSGLLKVLKINE